ncbi:MAG: phosphoribosylanthranilate isomerase [Phycisphaeraceae bacterium]
MIFPRIKICGLKTPEAIETATAAGAQAVGFVFAERSARYITPAAAADLAAAVPPYVDITGLFTTTPFDEIRRIAQAVPLITLQLHGDRFDAAAIAALAPHRVIRALSFEADTAVDQLRTWDQHYRNLPNLVGLIIDTPDPAKIGGGTGKTFDWHALRAVLDDVKPAAPIILAGGLTAGNVADAIQTVRPYAVDVSSGVESAPGIKDPDRITDFCQAVAAAHMANNEPRP